MKSTWMAPLALILFGGTAMAETMATSQLWIPDQEEPLYQEAAYSTPLPAYPPEVAKTLRDLGISLDAAPAGSLHPVVSVDKSTQTISIDVADFDEPWVRKVSTGGGLKIPNGEAVAGIKKPYCASTPEIGPKFVPAVQSGPNTTMSVVYHSKTFSYSGVPAAMPYAIRLEGGIFFHEVPSGKVDFSTPEGNKRATYSHLLGHNVSGECIRLDSQTAKLLYGLALKYGGITASVQGADPAPVREGYCQVVNGKKKCFSPNYCDEKTLAYAEKKIQAAQNGGGSTLFGGFGNFLQSIFGGGYSNGDSTPGSSKPTTSGKKRKSDDAWKYPLGDPFSN